MPREKIWIIFHNETSQDILTSLTEAFMYTAVLCVKRILRSNVNKKGLN